MAPIYRKWNKPLRVRVHGNYCGPGWSGGKFGSSLPIGGPSAIDAADHTCRVHDRAYGRKYNLKRADEKFYSENIGKGFKRSAMALGVGAQGLSRAEEPSEL